MATKIDEPVRKKHVALTPQANAFIYSQPANAGLARLAALRAHMTDAEGKDPALARRNRRFADHVESMQRRNLARIMERPDSQEYKDYIVHPNSFGNNLKTI